jgi:hypothetical protein
MRLARLRSVGGAPSSRSIGVARADGLARPPLPCGRNTATVLTSRGLELPRNTIRHSSPKTSVAQHAVIPGGREQRRGGHSDAALPEMLGEEENPSWRDHTHGQSAKCQP